MIYVCCIVDPIFRYLFLSKFLSTIFYNFVTWLLSLYLIIKMNNLFQQLCQPQYGIDCLSLSYSNLKTSKSGDLSYVHCMC